MSIRLGDILVERGVLTGEQRDEALRVQNGRARPIGAIIEQLFGVTPDAIEQAWGEQFSEHAERISPTLANVHPITRSIIDRRQAWQFSVIPIRFDGPELVCVTTPDALARAMRFVCWRVERQVRFGICDDDQMSRGLERLYPLRGVSLETLLGEINDLSARSA